MAVAYETIAKPINIDAYPFTEIISGGPWYLESA